MFAWGTTEALLIGASDSRHDRAPSSRGVGPTWSLRHDGAVSDLTRDIDHVYETVGDTPELLAAVDRVLEAAGEVDEARVAFERAGARDFLGLEGEAIPLYREALDRGLMEPERLQCLIQLGSSLRNVGDAQGAVHVLESARAEASGEGQDWVDAFLALALHSTGQTSQALAVALNALAPHLTLYGGAVTSYAEDLDSSD